MLPRRQASLYPSEVRPDGDRRQAGEYLERYDRDDGDHYGDDDDHDDDAEEEEDGLYVVTESHLATDDAYDDVSE